MVINRGNTIARLILVTLISRQDHAVMHPLDRPSYRCLIDMFSNKSNNLILIMSFVFGEEKEQLTRFWFARDQTISVAKK